MMHRARFLVLFALIAGVLAGASLTAPSPSSAATRQVTGGELNWGVKQAFRDYITTIAAGTITASDGATNNGGIFNFPQAAGTVDLTSDEATVSFDGTVQFVGHGGLLDLTITDVRLEIDGDSGTIVADVTSRDLDTQNYIQYPDVDLVTLDLTSVTPTELPASVSWADVPSVLTADAAPAFEGFYAPGTAFDDASAALDLDGVADLTWKVSQYAWTQVSLAQAHGTDAPAVKDAVNGFVFPSWDVTIDFADGSMDASFDGALILGNTAAGNFRIKLANPHIVIDDLGDGSLSADVSYCAPGCTGTYVGLSPNTLITTFDYDPGAVTVVGGLYSWTLTPHWATVGNQFAQPFLDALLPSMQGFFRATGSGLDSQKPPAPITVAFDCGSDVECDGFAAGDNCASVFNPDQANFDGDALGDVCDDDDDNDNCEDTAETGTSHVLGGERDPYNRWDFYDVNGTGSIDLADTIIVLAHFGHGYNGGAYLDPVDNLLDRYVPDIDFAWLSAEDNNGLDLTDALANLRSFGDHC